MRAGWYHLQTTLQYVVLSFNHKAAFTVSSKGTAKTSPIVIPLYSGANLSNLEFVGCAVSITRILDELHHSLEGIRKYNF